MKQYGFLLICLAMMTCSIGCIPLSSNSRGINELREELAQLQIEHRELKQNQADLYAKVDSSVTTIDALNAATQDLQNKLSLLNQSLQDSTMNPDKKSINDYDSVLPSSVYQSAYGDYSMGKFELAYSGFQSFVENYPNAELAPQAQFYMGECFYSREMLDQAVAEYKKVESDYEKSNFVPSERLKIALCYNRLGKQNESLDVFSSIVNDYSQSPEALTAKEKIKKYNNAKTKTR